MYPAVVITSVCPVQIFAFFGISNISVGVALGIKLNDKRLLFLNPRMEWGSLSK